MPKKIFKRRRSSGPPILVPSTCKSFYYRYALLPTFIFHYSFILFSKFAFSFTCRELMKFYFFHLNINHKKLTYLWKPGIINFQLRMEKECNSHVGSNDVILWDESKLARYLQGIEHIDGPPRNLSTLADLF